MIKWLTLLFFTCAFPAFAESVWWDPETGHILRYNPVDPSNPYRNSGEEITTGEKFYTDPKTKRRYFKVDESAIPAPQAGRDTTNGNQSTGSTENVDWQSDRRFSCDGAVHEVINHTTRVLGKGSEAIIRSVPLQLDKRRHTYTTVGVRDNFLVVQMLLENLHKTSGKTMCICAEFRDSTVDWPIAALGGSYGMRPDTRRNETDQASIDPVMAGFIDEVHIYAGYCPTNGVFKKTARILGQTAWQSARSYIAYKTNGTVNLPESPD